MNELNSNEKKIIKISKLNIMDNNKIINNITEYEFKYIIIFHKLYLKYYLNKDTILYIFNYLNLKTLLIIKTNLLTKQKILEKYKNLKIYKNNLKIYGLLYINNHLCNCFKLNFSNNLNNEIYKNNKKIYNKKLKKNIYLYTRYKKNKYIKYVNVSFNYDFIFKFYNKNIFNRQIKNINMSIIVD